MAIIYPIFQDCCKYTFDEYWKSIFEKCAKNKFPQGVKYNPQTHTLLYNKKKYKLPEDSIELFKIMITLFRDEMGMLSNRDKPVTPKIGDEPFGSDTDWKKIKPRYLKEHLILQYVDNLRKQYDLTIAEVKKLISLIHLGFQFHNIQNDDVEYENGIITNIYPLEYDKSKREFTIAYRNYHTKNSDKNNKKQNSPSKFYQSLDKFIKEQKNRLEKICV